MQCNFLEYDQAENSSVCRLHLQKKILNFHLEKFPQTQIGRLSQKRLVSENSLLMKSNILEAAFTDFLQKIYS